MASIPILLPTRAFRRAGGLDKQMKMIRHHHVGIQNNAVLFQAAGKRVKKTQMILIRMKHALPVVTAYRHMVLRPAKSYTPWPAHGNMKTGFLYPAAPNR